MQVIARASKILNVTVGVESVHLRAMIASFDRTQNASLRTQYQSVMYTDLNHHFRCKATLHCRSLRSK